MRITSALCLLGVVLWACSDSRVYEQVIDFDKQEWIVTDKPSFEFEIDDTNSKYNIFSDLRNAVSYPYARFYFTYYLQDSSGVEIQKKLIGQYLFDAKSGKPSGKSGIGDLYDHRFLLLQNFQFPQKGKYKIVLEQFMRMDTLPGIVAIGVRVEKAEAGKTPETY
ncbi:gliding motility lipoprotein GldH [Chryseolinea sp. T2]|uniref:gliding motility lipoprotein GldH n=1 Tax=Chryseolinea sp. T2 TaxID=3129255 RepID=UPI003077DCD4